MPKLREQCKNLTIDEIVQKAYDIQMSTTGPLVNLHFDHNSEKTKKK